MLGQIQPRRAKTYLNIKNGSIVRRTPEGAVESYSFVDGVAESISQRDRTFRGEVVKYWYLDLRDEESGDIYSLGFPYGSNTFKSIILQMASEKGLEALRNASPMKIEPYTQNGYDKVKVWSGGEQLNWAISTLPPIQSRNVGGRVVKDDSSRMALITDLAHKVREAIISSQETAAPRADLSENW